AENINIGVGTSGYFNSAKVNHLGVWSIYQSEHNVAAHIYQQSGLLAASATTGTISTYMTSSVYADFQRSGYQGLVAIGAGAARVLVTTNDVHYTSIALSGDLRNIGGVVGYDKTGDGYLDFAFGDIANTSLSFVTNAAGMLAWMNGTATTGTGRPTGAGVVNNYAEVSAVDLNNNGTVDVVEHTNGSGNYALTTFMNDQLTTDQFSMTHLAGVFVGGGEGSMTWADFNNDGYMDLFLGTGRNVTNTADSSASRIYWNNQVGGFGTGAGISGGTATYFLDALNSASSLAVDWNHDGKMDVLEIPLSGVTATPTIYLNQGGGVFAAGTSASTFSTTYFKGLTPLDFNWDGSVDLMVNLADAMTQPFLFNNNGVADGASLHLQINDSQGLNVYYANTVQLYNSAGVLVSSQIINPQMGLNSNYNSAIVYFYGLSALETYTAVLLKSVSGVSSDVSGVATLGGNTIENVNATWTGLTTGLATHNYVLSAEAGGNSANGNFIGTGYNDTFFATAGTDTFVGGGGWQTHYGTPAWSITRGEDVVDFTLAGSTAISVNLNTTTAQATGFNTVTLTGIEGITGGAGNDNLTANSTAGVNSLLDGRGGNDTYTISGGGH
ncbi:FG-GAP repeat domain-containing protein, partial [Pseudomonas zeae]|uniref:FG-GAP repeat domain-containing protein n=1 Tax=Pseudomonas zeae TaxID=2745510 RepID=UPI0039E0501A